MTTSIPYEGLVALVLALQFAAFGWRINREIAVGDEGRRTWFPVSDLLNVLSMAAVIAICVVGTIAGHNDHDVNTTVLAVAYTLIAMHPINIAAHYRLNTIDGRHKYTKVGCDYPYITDWEYVTLILTALFLMLTVWLVNY